MQTMLGLISFCFWFMCCAVAASGTAKLIMITIQPGEIFGGWQKVLDRIEPKYKRSFMRKLWYQRLGGCIVCTRQFIAELSFVVFAIVWCQYGDWPTSNMWWLWNWIISAAIWVGFCGTTLQIGQWLEYEKREADSMQDIVEQQPRKGEAQKSVRRGV